MRLRARSACFPEIRHRFNVFHDGDARERVGFKDVAGLVDLELLLRLSSYYVYPLTSRLSPIFRSPFVDTNFPSFFYSLLHDAFIIVFIFKRERGKNDL